MLDGLLGRGFTSKCKSWIKGTRTRIDVIRRKRDATQKFLKKDVADLLANGLDINAFGRVEGLLKELMLSWCYDFVEQSCDCILKHLSIMQKQSECPEECREAVSSLMFAAARFSDLPELRDLRNIFQEKYGNYVEHFVNKEFAENLTSKPPTREKKIQLMQDIASEFSIRWDSRTFEQTMSKPSASVPEKPKKVGSFNVIDDKHKLPNGQDTVLKRYKSDTSSRERHEGTNKGHKLQSDREGNHTNNLYQPLNSREAHDIPFQGRQELTADRHKMFIGKDAASETIRSGSSSHGKRHEGIDGAYKLHNIGENTVSKRENQETLSHGKSNSSATHVERLIKSDDRAVPFAGNKNTGQHNTGKSIREVEEVEKSYYNNAIPPPYVKPPKSSKHGANKGSKRAPIDPSTHNRAGATNTADGIQIRSDHLDHERQVFGSENGHHDHDRQVAGPARMNNRHDKSYQHQDDLTGDPIPKTRSSRRRHSRSPSSHNDVGNFEDSEAPMDPSIHIRASAKNRSERIQGGSDRSDHEGQFVGPVGHGHEKDYYYQDDITGDPLRRPRSLRRRRSKSLSHEDSDHIEGAGVVKRNSSSRRREHSRRGMQVVLDDGRYEIDEEERIIDRLLLHYSKKPTAYEPGKVRKKSKAHPSHHSGESPENESKEGPGVKSEIVPTTARSVSLPREQTSTSEATKVFARTKSFQPDMLNQARHVHPKLPDYDDLAARFAALKGR